MDYTMAQAKRDFERGFLASAEIKWLGLGNGYGLIVTSKLGMDDSGFLIDAKKHQPRQFKTADACIEAAKQIGFRAANLMIEGD